ncbi:hypothetical protein WJX79_009937 [Trebouxia sp. C0005]
MSNSVLDVRNLKRVVDGRVIITNLSFSVKSPGDVLFIRGASGVGKSLLLRVLACLDPLQEGILTLDDRTPRQIGVPNWRSLITYVPQARVTLKGTPSELYFTAQRFAAQKGRPRGDLPALIHELGLQQGVLNQSWAELSGGEAQRVLLAVTLALKPQFVLLDEVTSALDHESALKAEKVLRESVYLSPWAVGLAALLLLINGLFSVYLCLGLHKTLGTAAIRCTIQLTILGYILVPIFSYDRWWLVLLYAGFMITIAAAEAVSRPSAVYQGMLVHTLGVVGGAATGVICYAMLLIIRVQPWWHAQYFIPTLGMILGNCISGVSVGLSSVMEELTTGKGRIELLLALGATRMEATRETMQRCLVLALTPVLNQMSVMGVVSIPGMMTGQILGGTVPSQAARYQIMIMFLIAATTCIAVVGSVYLAVLNILDRQHRLCSEKILPRAAAGSGVEHWIQGQTVRGFKFVSKGATRIIGRIRVSYGQRERLSTVFRGTGLARRFKQNRSNRHQGDEYDELGPVTSQLHDVIIGASDDESQSLVYGASGALSDNDADGQSFTDASERFRPGSSTGSVSDFGTKSPSQL